MGGRAKKYHVVWKTRNLWLLTCVNKAELSYRPVYSIDQWKFPHSGKKINLATVV